MPIKYPHLRKNISRLKELEIRDEHISYRGIHILGHGAYRIRYYENGKIRETREYPAPYFCTMIIDKHLDDKCSLRDSELLLQEKLNQLEIDLYNDNI